jgi:hypothetical protein
MAVDTFMAYVGVYPAAADAEADSTWSRICTPRPA